MAQDLTEHFSTRTTPQDSPIPGSAQVENTAGGYAWEVGPFERLLRFLVLGTEGGTYYIGERKLTVENAENLLAMIAEDGVSVVRTIAEVSDSGRAPKNGPAIFALALASAVGDDATRKAAFEAVPEVCRIGTHLFTFFEYRKAFGGRGRGFRTALRRWYTERDPEALARQLLKYRQRAGVSHGDVLRLARPKPPNPTYDALFRYAVKGQLAFDPEDNHDALGNLDTGEEVVVHSVGREKPREGFLAYREAATGDDAAAFELVEGFEQAQAAEDATEVARLVRKHNLTREMVPTEFLSQTRVQEALLERMPMMATIRSLGPFTASGLIQPMSETSKLVVNRINDAEAIRRARVHPVSILVALLTYRSGAGIRGNMKWTPVPQIVDALDDAFYASFDSIEPTGKRFVLGVDVSGSMGWRHCAGAEQLLCSQGAAVMAMVTARTERDYFLMGFSSSFVELPVTSRSTLAEACNAVQSRTFGSTDCSLPFQWAEQVGVDADAFVVYTDNETWSGSIHPSQALASYRRARVEGARSAVVGMASNGFSIADPNDPGMLDFVGFDTSTPAALAAFVR